jgi:hypothetical protein
VLCLSSISSSGDGGRSCSNSHDGDLEDLHSSEDNSNSSSDDNPQASHSEREHPFLPSGKQQNQRDGETTTARGLEASAAAAESALERAAAYRKTQASVVVPNEESSSDSTTSRFSEAPTKVREKDLEVDDKNKKNNNKAAVVALSAFERAQAYRKQQAEMVAALVGRKEEKNKNKNKSAAKLNSLEEEAAAATAVPNKEEEEEDEGEADEKNKMVEIEIYTRDGIVRRKVSKPETAFSNVRDIKRKGMSDIDFAGLGFADKKSSGTPAGLSQGFTVPTGALPEVEILTREGAQGKQPQTTTASEETDLYKPRVSTWGVFPRPADISKTVSTHAMMKVT